MVLALLLGSAHQVAQAKDDAPVYSIDISRASLSEALQRFSEQTSLQLLYEQGAVLDWRTARVRGKFSAAVTLNKLLKGTDLEWRFINSGMIAITSSRTGIAQPAAASKPDSKQAHVTTIKSDFTQLDDVDVTVQQPWWANLESNSAFGFDKLMLETPRSMSFVGGDTIDVFSLSAVEDLLRLVPGVFTTTRFGVQGSIDIRNVPADTYFRGMKRLTLQGHGRSVLAAMDSIEVVGGPASPLYGIGKIGGYTNVVPKSGRARDGKYLMDTQGFVQLIGGQYERREASFGLGGPVSLGKFSDKHGGFYVYGLIEDSDSFAEGVPIKQKVAQAATSIDDMWGAFRLETGVSYQESRTSGALVGRLTQRLVDDGAYVGGSPLVNLDLNGNGTIGYVEMQTASPVRGRLTANNQPLNQVFPWPVAANGQPLTLDQFPKIRGIPQSMYNYLVANPQADPTGLLRAQGVGGPLPISGAVPVGMVLDPRSITSSVYNPRHSPAFENDLKAEFITAFADFVYDQNADFTVKNQLFFDSMNQYKSSRQPFSQVQNVNVFEDKLTLTRRAPTLPDWLHVNSLMSVNIRDTISLGKMTLADYGNHRTDATAANWNDSTAGMTANTTFTSSNDNSSLSGDGLPWASIYRTEFSEFGIGLLFDIDLFTNTHVLLGGRYDGSQAQNTDYAGRFNINTGTASNPGAYLQTNDTARGWDTGASWSISVSQSLPYGLHPYVTLARSSIMLDGNNNSLLNTVILAGHIGTSSMQEAGIKASWLDNRISLATAVYNQGREDVSDADDPTVLNVYATATTTRGWQTELNLAPTKQIVIGLYALKQVTRYTPNIGGTIQVDARALGFMDVRDAAGNIIYPAEAFLYGGRARILLPNGLKQYERKQGNPEHQMGMTAIYQVARHWGLTLKSNYLSSTCAGRLCLVKLPQSLVFDTGVFWTDRNLDIKLDASNISNQHYFRARTGDTLGDVIAQAMPGRRWQITARYKF
jgi:outer membrane receptor for ferric coprogen and ferric-rhodotorulic acid